MEFNTTHCSGKFHETPQNTNPQQKQTICLQRKAISGEPPQSFAPTRRHLRAARVPDGVLAGAAAPRGGETGVHLLRPRTDGFPRAETPSKKAVQARAKWSWAARFLGPPAKSSTKLWVKLGNWLKTLKGQKAKGPDGWLRHQGKRNKLRGGDLQLFGKGVAGVWGEKEMWADESSVKCVGG